ncbi:CopM family metallochaperone [Rubrimonas cliftonensis]|uniref:DUF305 domain-containing protein n=1 Tax=Rubrimonas cliftonensis TaxID=89524 RepID=A0A1H4C2Z4_9RHOB|nr:DUF305 domain-containing protein [Rubrimonas cliftonensis]SEA54749.1 protein of unknown function [Rubrimonas cliftonensis]
MGKRQAALAAALWLLGAGAAHAQGAQPAHGSAHGAGRDAGHGSHMAASTGAAATGGQESAASRAFREANDRMHHDMAIALTGDADVDFMRGMIPHHQGAIDMARIVLDHGTDPETRALASDIMATQTREIEQIAAWLAARGF